MKYLIGIDIGGTKISIVLGNSQGKILEKRILKTRVGRGARASVTEIVLAINEILNTRSLRAKNLLGIGIGVPGPVDPKKEQIERSPNLPKWENISIRSILKSNFNCPIFLENDANAAALGEKYFGEGRKIKNFVYMTVSTGIGSGIVLNGELVRGASGAAGEIGHTAIRIGGEPCLCGKRGCLETYSSGTSIAKFAKRALKVGIKSKILQFAGSINQVGGASVSKASLIGDALAIKVRHEAAGYLGESLGNLINLLNPERIILGGGVLENPKHFWIPMMAAIRREAWPRLLKKCKVVRTKLGKRVGDYGALAVVLDRIKH